MCVSVCVCVCLCVCVPKTVKVGLSCLRLCPVSAFPVTAGSVRRWGERSSWLIGQNNVFSFSIPVNYLCSNWHVVTIITLFF